MSKYSVPTVAQIKKRLRENGPLFEVVSLFAGGGGSSCGYRMAGGKVLAINEFIPEARKSYAENWPDTKIFPQDIRDLTGQMILDAIGKKPGELDILDGSPPCSAFSTAGARDRLWGKTKAYSDASQSSVENLFFEFTRILTEIQPKVFIAENVSGLAKGVSKGFLNEFFREFDRAGYVTRAKLLNARWLGVPQSRERLIFVGVRKDLWRNEFEGKTHPKPLNHQVTLREAFEGLTFTEADRAETDITRYSIYKLLTALKPGQQHPKRFNLVKLSPDRPANTLTATTGNPGAAKPCHWNNRALTVAECKRITSIPDDYILTGKYSQRIERLGRMVPPLMMKAVAENVHKNILTKIKGG